MDEFEVKAYRLLDRVLEHMTLKSRVEIVKPLYGKGKDNLKGKWEAYHFAEYVNFIENNKDVHKKTDKYESLNEKFQQGPLTSLQKFTRMPSDKGYTEQNSSLAINALCEFQDISRLECFTRFLEFCLSKGYPLLAFTVNGKFDANALKKTISDFRTHLRGVGLCISLVDTVEGGKCYELKTGQADDKLTIDDKRTEIERDNPVHQLRWEYHLTKFIRRKTESNELDELDELGHWLNSDNKISIKLIYGEGGVGKTRLAFHFAKQFIDQGWAAGASEPSFVGNWQFGEQGILLIIDYPEERRESVKKLMRALSKYKPPKDIRVRVLMLSRNLDILETIARQSGGINHSYPMYLEGFKEVDEAWDLFQQAWRAINKETLNETANDIVVGEKNPPINLCSFEKWLNIGANGETDNSHSKPLIIIALAAYIPATKNFSDDLLLGLNSQKLIRYLTEREADRIEREVKSLLPDVVDFRAVLLTLAIAGITNGLDAHAINRIRVELKDEALDLLPPPINYLKELVPWNKKKNQLLAYKPDILAADFLAYCLKRYAEPEEANWVFSALGFGDLDADEAGHSKLQCNFARLGRLIFDSKAILNDSNHWPINKLQKEIRKRPSYCIWLTDQVTGRHLGPHLLPLALEAAQQAIIDRKQRAEIDFESHGRHYIRNLHTFSNYLIKANRLDESAKFIEQAFAACQILIKSNGLLYANDLANVLTSLSSTYTRIYEHNKALQICVDATHVHQQLYSYDAEMFGSGYVSCLSQLSDCMANNDQSDEGLKAATLALQIHQKLNDSHRSTLANCLVSRSNRLTELGQKEKALEDIRLAVDVYGELLKDNFATVGMSYSTMLINCAEKLVGVGRVNEGIRKTERAVDIRELFTKVNSRVYGPELAHSLNAHSVYLLEVGNKQKALVQSARSIKIYEDAAKHNQHVYAPLLASSLNNRSIILMNADEREAGCKTMLRAINIYKNILHSNLLEFGPLLITCIKNLSGYFYKMGDDELGLETKGHILEVHEKLTKSDFARFSPDYAADLYGLSIELHRAGKWGGGFPMIEIAIKIYEQLASKDFNRYRLCLGAALYWCCSAYRGQSARLIQLKDIYMQVRSKCSEPWVKNFPDTLKALLAQAKLNGEQEIIIAIESIQREIN